MGIHRQKEDFLKKKMYCVPFSVIHKGVSVIITRVIITVKNRPRISLVKLVAIKKICSTSISKTKGLELTQVFPLVSGISQTRTLSICGTHVGHKLLKANQCLFILRSLRKEGYTKAELDHLFQSRSRSTVLLMQVYIKPYIL